MRARALLGLVLIGIPGYAQTGSKPLPATIQAIMNKPRYAGSTWALRVVDVQSGDVIYDLNSQELLLTASVRKLYSVSDLLNRVGPDYRFKTPVYRQGEVDGSGNLKGNLVLQAEGDLTMGGRDLPGGRIAITDFDHNDANNLGGATLTAPNPLAGLDKLAEQVAAAGITKVSGDVIIDDRLFKPFRVPNGNLLVTPIIINDNRIDLTVLPAKPGEPAQIDWRPHTAAFHVTNKVMTVAAGGDTDVTLTQKGPREGEVSGTIAADYVPPLAGVKTLVRTFSVDDPANLQNLEVPADFARTTFIEALGRAGVTVTAPLLAENALAKLPAPHCYQESDRVAVLVSDHYSQYAKLILKVSHNLGANLSLMIFGLTYDVKTVADALQIERTTLIDHDGLDGNGFHFPTNGSGSPDSSAFAATTVDLLQFMRQQKTFPPYFRALPVLGVDGSLATVGVDSPAKGKVFAKTGTYLNQDGIGAQNLAGFIDARSGRRLVYALFLNNGGPVTGIPDVLGVIDDEADISTIIQQSN